MHLYLECSLQERTVSQLLSSLEILTLRFVDNGFYTRESFGKCQAIIAIANIACCVFTVLSVGEISAMNSFSYAENQILLPSESAMAPSKFLIS